jgi:osmotically inducible protein OsmC
MAADQTADVTWDGDLAHGRGEVSVDSGALPQFDVTWASRTERQQGKTSPEELIAAAHASCFSMALSNTLAQAGTPPERLAVRATATFDTTEAGPAITKVNLAVNGRVPNIDEGAFREAANAAKDGCPVSKALAGNVEINLDAALEQ